MLRSAGVAFTQIAAAINEDEPKRTLRNQGAKVVALHLAHAKASAVDPGDDTLVIGADQILVCDDVWFDKPAGLAGAQAHLRALRGRSHQLVTAVVLHRGGLPIWEHVAIPVLTMRDVSDNAIDALLALDGAACVHTVGAYRVEGPGVQLFSAIDGEWSAVLGLPLLPLLEAMRAQGTDALLPI